MKIHITPTFGSWSRFTIENPTPTFGSWSRFTSENSTFEGFLLVGLLMGRKPFLLKPQLSRSIVVPQLVSPKSSLEALSRDHN